MRQTFCSFCFPLFLFFLSISTWSFHGMTANDLISQTCRKCAQRDPTLYNFCVTSFQADPERHCAADLRELGMISIRLLRRNITNSRLYIKKLLQNEKLEPFIRSCLNDCFVFYSDAIHSTKRAIDDYKSRHYDHANLDVSAIMNAPMDCEDGFKEGEGAVSPLTKRNNDTFQLSSISLSIINMLRNYSLV